MQSLLQTVMKKQTVLPIAVSGTTTKQEGKAYIAFTQGRQPCCHAVGRISAIVIPADPPLSCIMICCPSLIHPEIKGDHIRIRILQKGLQYLLLIAFVKPDIFV